MKIKMHYFFKEMFNGYQYQLPPNIFYGHWKFLKENVPHLSKRDVHSSSVFAFAVIKHSTKRVEDKLQSKLINGK